MEKHDQEIDVYINGVPHLELIPKEIAQTLFVVLEQQIVEYVKNEKTAHNTNDNIMSET